MPVPHSPLSRPPSDSGGQPLRHDDGRRDGLVVRYWRGQEPLWKAYWLIGMLGGLANALVLGVLYGAGVLPLGLVQMMALGYMVWSSVAIWRCAWNVGWAGWGMIARLLVVVGVFVSIGQFAAMARAAEVQLTGPEIVAALSGNTATGSGSPWRQYFAPLGADGSGATVYEGDRGRQPQTGRWRVDGDAYCSWWPGGGWTCYAMVRDGETIIWVPPAGRTTPARLLSGNWVE